MGDNDGDGNDNRMISVQLNAADDDGGDNDDDDDDVIRSRGRPVVDRAKGSFKFHASAIIGIILIIIVAIVAIVIIVFFLIGTNLYRHPHH